MKMYFLQGLGILLVVDGAWSLQTQKNKHWFVGDLGRWVRIGFGVALLLI